MIINVILDEHSQQREGNGFWNRILGKAMGRIPKD